MFTSRKNEIAEAEEKAFKFVVTLVVNQHISLVILFTSFLVADENFKLPHKM